MDSKCRNAFHVVITSSIVNSLKHLLKHVQGFFLPPDKFRNRPVFGLSGLYQKMGLPPERFGLHTNLGRLANPRPRSHGPMPILPLSPSANGGSAIRERRCHRTVVTTEDQGPAQSGRPKRTPSPTSASKAQTGGNEQALNASVRCVEGIVGALTESVAAWRVSSSHLPALLLLDPLSCWNPKLVFEI